MSGVVGAIVRSARRSMSFSGKESTVLYQHAFADTDAVAEVVQREDSDPNQPAAKSPETAKKEATMPAQLRKEIEHRRRDSGHAASPVSSPASSPSVPHVVTSPAPASPPAVRPGRQSIALDEDVRQCLLTCSKISQEALRFDYENLKLNANIRSDPLLQALEIPSTLELVTIERKRRYPVPSNFNSLLKEPSLRPYIKYYLSLFASNWRQLRARPEVTLRAPPPVDPPGQLLPGDEKEGSSVIAAPAGDIAPSDFVKAFDLKNAPPAAKRGMYQDIHVLSLSLDRTELLSIAALQPLALKPAVEVLPFSEAPIAYRWLQLEPKELKMMLGDFEPFYCQFALYDLSKKARLSEVFHWEAQPTDSAVARPPQRAVFSLSYPSPDVCIVVRIEKILQADIEAIAEAYGAPDKAKDRDREKFRRDVKDLLTARGKQAPQYRQLFGYALIPIFNDDRTLMLGDDISVKPLYRPAKGELNDAALLALLTERSGSMSLRRMRTIAGHLSVSLSEHFDVPAKRMDVSLEGCGGAAPGDDSPLEVQEFSFVPRVTPHIFLVNNLYVYLDSVNLASRTGATSAKNICVRVQLLATDRANPSPLNAIYGRDKFLTTAFYSSIQYHNKSPLFYDEIKIKLPLALTTSHHLLFTFLHVPCKAREQEAIVGYSVLPILSNEVLMASRENSLPIILDSLPANYLSPEAEEHLKYLENKRPMFRCRLSLVSSVYTQDDGLARALSTIDYLPDMNIASTSEDQERHLSSGLRLLRLVSPLTLISFLPPLLTHLITLLSLPSQQREAFNTLIDVLHSVYLDATGSALSLATTYAEFVAAPSVQVYEDIVRLWSDAIRSLEANSAGEKFVVFSGFWLRLIAKSMAAAPKPPTYTDGFTRNLKALVTLLCCEEANHARTTLNLAKEMNRNIALFLRDLFELMDRGLVCGLVERALNTLTPPAGAPAGASPPASVVCDLKCDFLRIIAESPYYLPLNLPVPHPLPADNLLVAWESHHFLAALLLKTVESYITAQDRPLRTKAVMLLVSVLAQHELDARCVDAALRDRVALLYLPWLPLLSQHWSFISAQYSFEERRRVLLTWLWVSNSLSVTSLVLWWRAAPLRHQVAYLEGLVMCAQTFEFVGAARLAELVAERPEVDKSIEAKAQLESYYTKQLSAASNPRERFSNLRQRRAELRAADAEGAAERPSRHARSLSGGQHQMQQVTKSATLSGKNPMGIMQQSSTTVGGPTGSMVAVPPQAPANTEAQERALSAAVSHSLAQLADAFVEFLLQIGSSLRSPKRDPLVDGTVDLVATMLSKQQTLSTLRELYAMLMRHMPRLGPIFFLTRHNYVSKLVAAALAHCVSSNASLAAAAGQHLYLLCCTNASLQTENFPRMKIQLTIALSQFVSQGIKEEETNRLRRTLLALRTRADTDRSNSVFASQIGELISALLLVQTETAGLRAASDDAYRVCDQLLRLAAGHRHAPELRVAWLESLSSFHANAKNFAEAAEAHLRVAAIVYFCASPPLPGALSRALFLAASPNLKEEFESLPKGIETQTFESPAFGAEGFLRSLDSAVQALIEAQLYERANDASKITVAFLEATRDYTRLVDAHARLQTIFEKLAISVRSNVRQLGSYYRVVLFGSAFGEVEGQSFVYREARLTRLGEMRDRLVEVFQKRLEGKQLQVITDSKEVDRTKLDATQCYLQMTSVEPIFEAGNTQAGHTDSFMFETPYTLDGQAYAPNIADQYKRKVFLKTERPFPDLTMRIKVASRNEKTITPIENAIEILEGKSDMIQREVSSSTPSINRLQLSLQGAVRTQVNQGPQEICRAFLGSGRNFPQEQIEHLRTAFRHFLALCSEALQVNKSLIGPEQLAFHQELEQGYKQLCAIAAEHGVTPDRTAN